MIKVNADAKRKDLYNALLDIMRDANFNFEQTIAAVAKLMLDNIDTLTYREAEAFEALYVKSLSDKERAAYDKHMQQLYKNRIGRIVEEMAKCAEVDTLAQQQTQIVKTKNGDEVMIHVTGLRYEDVKTKESYADIEGVYPAD